MLSSTSLQAKEAVEASRLVAERALTCSPAWPCRASSSRSGSGARGRSGTAPARHQRLSVTRTSHVKHAVLQVAPAEVARAATRVAQSSWTRSRLVPARSRLHRPQQTAVASRLDSAQPKLAVWQRGRGTCGLAVPMGKLSVLAWLLGCWPARAASQHPRFTLQVSCKRAGHEAIKLEQAGVLAGSGTHDA